MDPLNVILSVVAAAFILKMWISDYMAWKKGTPFERAIAGATGAPMRLVWLSVIVSVGIVIIESAGEYALGATTAQSTIPWYYLAAMLGAGIVEEMIFRGYLVIQTKGRKTLIASIIIFSIAFALIHGHLLGWSKDTYSFEVKLAPGPIWWTLILFTNSLWWYAVRFMPSNKDHSLLPCFAGHMASNLAVFVIKLAEGYVSF